ncbi:CU044_5270 family protein [Nonomuraea sp. K274]|uniref:CU044_5270 family protein n=1 Tax=Nonomuraea cypriaca TaxID=1187855 RepID=A0A931F1C2_9ACTN|nr:CU044_5270 family protein [Nonomuraea cypriaca]MBF8190340.1 CU044_5270 family protein [Nonomuraea cypriaca]
MNPMEELRAARPAHLGERPVDELTRAGELARAMSGPRSSRRRHKVVKPVWGFGLAGAAAAVTAVAVLVSGNGAAPTTPRAPDGGQVAAGSATAQPVRLSARTVLLAAAEKADQQSDGSGDSWRSVSVSRTLFNAKDGGYTIVAPQRSEAWTPGATGGDQWSRTQSLGARPATEEDERAWQEAGSPPKIEVVVPGKKGASYILSTSEGEVRTSHSPLVDGDKVFWLGRNVTMKDLRALPSEPDELKKWLMASYEGHGTESSGEEMSGDAWLFKVTVGLIMDMPVTPEVRGAAFRMLADLDGVEVARDVTDAEGRQGTAVTIKEDTPDSGVLENRLIFDESTGRALANESVVVRPGRFQAGLEPGAVWNSTTVLEAGWTDTKPSA